MQTLVVMVVAHDKVEAHTKAEVLARPTFGDRFVRAEVTPTPLRAAKRFPAEHVFQVSLILTPGSLEEWQGGPVEFAD